MMQILLTVNIMWNFRYHGSDFFFNVGEIVLNVSAPYRNTCSRLLIIPTISGDPPKINLRNKNNLNKFRLKFLETKKSHLDKSVRT